MDIVKNTLERTRKTIKRYSMLSPGDRVIVAVSGGPDSVCLLDLLGRLSDEFQISLIVAHYDHGLRELEDESETILVRELASSMDLAFETGRDISLRHMSSSVEEHARVARYGFLEKTAAKFSAHKIAMGHTLNDQAETVLMRLLRGSGISGLAGIPPVRESRIIRPIIEIKRDTVMSYLEKRELPYAVDSSNSSILFLRNRIRAELLPIMGKYQPRLIEHLGQLADMMREEDIFIEEQAKGWVTEKAEQGSDREFFVPLAAFKELPLPIRNRAARLLLRKAGNNLRRIDYDHIISVLDLAGSERSQASLDLPNNITVRKIYDRLLFTTSEKTSPVEFHLSLDGPGFFHIEETGKQIRIEVVAGVMESPGKEPGRTVFLDADKLDYPLTVRNFRPGDRFMPLGMKGRKKIKDFFIDIKVPSGTRAVTPILLSKDTPVWVCGFRIDERFKVTPQTRNIIKVTVS